MSEIIDFYTSGGSGWAGPVEAQIAWESLKRQGCFFENITQYIGDNGQSKMMLYEITRKLLGKDTENYPQEIGDPFVAGTMVLMSDCSEKKIEDIKIGDVVKNHLLEDANVTNIIKKKFTGNLITIKLNYFDREVTATETHHGLIWNWDCTHYKRVKFGELKIRDIVLTISPNRAEFCDIEKIETKNVTDEEVYCIVTENHYTAVFNGQAHSNCVSFGMKNAIEYLQAVEIFLKGDEEEWHPVFPPYLYGTGRVFSGGGRLPCFSDGSLGAWMADAVIKYGTIFSDLPNVPKYSGSIAKKWGCRPGPPEEFLNIGKQHLVKSAASINTWDELKAAIINGYPVTVASNQGFRMTPSSDGYHRASGSWGHQMCIIGVGTYKGEDYCIILNSWGDAMGELRDFDDPSIILPVGCIRARRSEIENSMIRNGEVFAISSLDGIKKRKLDRELFKPF